MSAGPQAARAAASSSTAATVQDRKLHQLDPPVRATLNAVLSASEGGASSVTGIPSSSSWDDREVARQLALLTEERDFLRKYVSRCEAELKAAQLQYPDLVKGHTAAAAGESDLLNELAGTVEELPPWIGQAKYMSPLLVAYEARIEELTEKNQEQLHDFAVLKQQYDELYKRNAEAEAELEQNIKTLLTHMDEQKGKAAAVSVGKGGGVLDEDEVSELAEQVSLYKEQLDIVSSQKLELEGEVARLNTQVEAAKAERDRFWAGEVQKYQTNLDALRLERDRFKSSSSNLNQTVVELSALQKEHAALQKKFLATQVTLEETENRLDAALEAEKSASANLANAERDLESLLKSVAHMEGEMEAAKGREVAAVKRESELVRAAEAARLDKDQALQREQHLRTELARLADKTANDAAATQRTHAEEMAALYEQKKEVENRLQTQLSDVQLLLAEAEVAREREQREKRQAQDEAAKVYAQAQEDAVSLRQALGDSETRSTELSHARDDLRDKLSRADAELARATEFFAKEKSALSDALANARLKHESLALEHAHAQAQLARQGEHLSRLEKDLVESKRSSGVTIARLQSQLLEVEGSRKAQVDELKLRLEEAYRLHEVSESRATELLAAQELLANKWSDENKKVRAELSKALADEKKVTAALHARLAELEARVAQVVRERDQAMAFQSQYDQLKKTHEAAVAELTHRCESLSAELATYVRREPEWSLREKTLQGKLDRAEIDVKRLSRQWEAARRKIEFLEAQAAGITNLPPSLPAQPLQPTNSAINQANIVAGTTATSGTTAATTPAHLQPIPFAPSLLPPTFAKRS